ncbi:hypothetical protein QBC33DRAFT_108534 [Phialemonium atrogriseum]|uniref:Uncharacterized protein n=1 Tax=Phialemonium atrogriseum TaxID=1093897 RepID=A0AAJ0BZ59_9PEZI|nr:uncharacterized protein QBC33DRAFT_108534 [Phialemonium atrogriseum]KAK1766113.1 hypothetical protein QBC33DRAFT_108534 [Phialemonium atrogriseum]
MQPPARPFYNEHRTALGQQVWLRLHCGYTTPAANSASPKYRQQFARPFTIKDYLVACQDLTRNSISGCPGTRYHPSSSRPGNVPHNDHHRLTMKSENVTTASEGARNSLSDKPVLDKHQLNGATPEAPSASKKRKTSQDTYLVQDAASEDDEGDPSIYDDDIVRSVKLMAAQSADMKKFVGTNANAQRLIAAVADEIKKLIAALADDIQKLSAALADDIAKLIAALVDEIAKLVAAQTDKIAKHTNAPNREETTTTTVSLPGPSGGVEVRDGVATADCLGQQLVLGKPRIRDSRDRNQEATR